MISLVTFRVLLSLFVINVLAGPLSVPFGLHPSRNDSELVQPFNAKAVGFSGNCFDQRQPYDIQLKPIKYLDCIEAARQATFGGKAGAPMHFSGDPRAGMVMPETWVYGTCAVRIDMKQQEDEDVFSMFIVANGASHLAERCSDHNKKSPGLGGLTLIGPKKVVLLFVYGITPRPAPKPRPTLLAELSTS
ncbi:MAG: hypothetical protein L6R40_006023 [Gallowayella cf. fulva]|nr:MAG: hypothetical protein L6R40_006023 [Xanthomendoza cf. fulva]